MALWKEASKSSPDVTAEANPPARFDVGPTERNQPTPPKLAAEPERAVSRSAGGAESMIAPDITIEGKIQGAGHVRIAGRFEGDVNVDGDLSIDSGAVVTGSVRAHKVTVAGELVGNIEQASHVELLSTGALTGDLKAGSLTVASGSRMRGQAEFGWDAGSKPGNGAGKPVGLRKNGDKQDDPGHGAEGNSSVS